jgi:hypothetical protein
LKTGRPPALIEKALACSLRFRGQIETHNSFHHLGRRQVGVESPARTGGVHGFFCSQFDERVDALLKRTFH